MKEAVSKIVSDIVGAADSKQIQDLLETPPDSSMGDIAIPCFSFAKVLHKNPAIIAEDIKEKIDQHKEDLGIDKAVVMGGYCNLFVNRESFVKSVLTSMEGDDLGVTKTGTGKTICIDYSSPNIAKNFHVGHLRTTVIGNSLYKIYDKLGYKVVRINHLGDWGTQFGKLIVAYKKWSSK